MNSFLFIVAFVIFFRIYKFRSGENDLDGQTLRITHWKIDFGQDNVYENYNCSKGVLSQGISARNLCDNFRRLKIVRNFDLGFMNSLRSLGSLGPLGLPLFWLGLPSFWLGLPQGSQESQESQESLGPLGLPLLLLGLPSFWVGLPRDPRDSRDSGDPKGPQENW